MSRRSTKNSQQQKQSQTEATDHLTQKDELPGVDYKSNLGPRSLRHNRLNLSTPEGETRFLSSVTKELGKKNNIHKIQTAFQNHSLQKTGAATVLASKTILCSNQQITAILDSPLQGIGSSCYIQKFKNEGLIKEIPVPHEDDELRPQDRHARPSVIAVNLKWRNGIKVKQLHQYTSRTQQLEPIMKKTGFEYDSKMKFTSQVESVCEELFPDWKQKLMILDGNDCHGQSGGDSNKSSSGSKTSKSDKLQEDPSPSQWSSLVGDAVTREWKELTDLEEHKLLVLPFHSKGGFDNDLSKRYQFPYQAKFVVGKKVYQYKFVLQLPLSKSPQHYGLIFTFSEDPKGHSKLRIKSLLTVYSVCPVAKKFACLETYANATEAHGESESESTNKTKRTSSARAAKNAVELLSDNLKEEKLVSGGCYGFQLDINLPQPGQDCFRYKRLYDDGTLMGKKQKKQQLLRNIKMEQARA